MPRHCPPLCFVVFAALAIQAHVTRAADPTVWVFTADRLPSLQNIDKADRLFVLDRADNALKRLSFPNPGVEVAARDRAMGILRSPKGRVALASMRSSAEATVVAWQHGIEKLPAVLVDGQFVVYGLYDVTSAAAHVARYRDAR